MEYQEIKLKENANSPYIPVCMAANCLFIVVRKEIEMNCRPFNVWVLEPVAEWELEKFRSEVREFDWCEEWWEGEVERGIFEGTLEEYVENMRDMIDKDRNPEAYIGKNDDFSYIFAYYPDLRGIIDGYLDKHKIMKVGTWSCEGNYRPDSGMKNMQIMFNQELFDKIKLKTF